MPSALNVDHLALIQLSWWSTQWGDHVITLLYTLGQVAQIFRSGSSIVDTEVNCWKETVPAVHKSGGVHPLVPMNPAS